MVRVLLFLQAAGPGKVAGRCFDPSFVNDAAVTHQHKGHGLGKRCIRRNLERRVKVPGQGELTMSLHVVLPSAHAYQRLNDSKQEPCKCATAVK